MQVISHLCKCWKKQLNYGEHANTAPSGVSTSAPHHIPKRSAARICRNKLIIIIVWHPYVLLWVPLGELDHLLLEQTSTRRWSCNGIWIPVYPIVLVKPVPGWATSAPPWRTTDSSCDTALGGTTELMSKKSWHSTQICKQYNLSRNWHIFTLQHIFCPGEVRTRHQEISLKRGNCCFLI